MKNETKIQIDLPVDGHKALEALFELLPEPKKKLLAERFVTELFLRYQFTPQSVEQILVPLVKDKLKAFIGDEISKLSLGDKIQLKASEMLTEDEIRGMLIRRFEEHLRAISGQVLWNSINNELLPKEQREKIAYDAAKEFYCDWLKRNETRNDAQIQNILSRSLSEVILDHKLSS